ncbi:hypothetical protein ECC02_013808 [Trypanosoma cruzi]|uniref:Uncharacterized protein n=1 Tax=Trypanosoma cruzi TaxID=5693 RepID=A0A7J6XH88_TRYCR|nr:hypothetical protein ECC02_013808 [Trypanosoma cruzi]
MPIDMGFSLLQPLLSADHAGLNRSRLVVQRHPCSHPIECWHGGGSRQGQAAAAVLLPWIEGEAYFMSASQPPRPTAASSSLGGGSTAPCASSAASGLLGPVAAAPPPTLSLTASSPVGLSHNGRHTIGGHIAVVRNIALLLRLLRRTRGVAGRNHSVAVVASGATSFSSGDGCFWGAAKSTSFGGVPRPFSMLSATGTDAPGNPFSVDAGGTVLLHMLSPRRPTEPLEVGYRWCQISYTPARGHGK